MGLVDDLLTEHAYGRLSDAELCAMVAEKSHAISFFEVGRFRRERPELWGRLLQWFDAIGRGEGSETSEGAIDIDPRARPAASKMYKHCYWIWALVSGFLLSFEVHRGYYVRALFWLSFCSLMVVDILRRSQKEKL